ncbi:MAG: Uma2 family endonuclease [Iamia sp.]
MALAARDHNMTAVEFFATTDELPRAQLIDGELIVVDSPAARHNRIIFELAYRFRRHSESHPDAGELGAGADVPLDEQNVYVPDLWWVPDDQRLASEESRFPVPPPLVVEVRSPSTWRYDIGTKLRHYESSGVAEVWLIDTAADVVLIYRRSDSDATTFDVALELTVDDTLTTPLVPGWDVDLRALFSC